MRSKTAPCRRPTQLDDLDDSALALVFRAVPASGRRRLPLVCRRWRAVCDTAPQVVWEDVQVDFSSGMVEDSSAMYRWFVQRRGVVKNLSLVVETDEDWMSAHLVLGLLAGTLEQLTVQAGHEGLGLTSLAWLAVLRHLKALHLDYDNLPLVQDCSVFPPGLEKLSMKPYFKERLHELPRGLSKLTLLRELSLRQVNFNPLGPHRHPLTPLSCLTALQRLEMREGSMTLPSQLTSLVKLSALDLSNNLVKPEGLAVLGRLRSLQDLVLGECALVQLPACIVSLPQLRRLKLLGNLLTTLPAGPYLSHLTALDISWNRFKELPTSLLSCTSLQLLRVEGRRALPQEDSDQDKMRLTSRDVRQLLINNPQMRMLSMSSDSGFGSFQRATLASRFPQVLLVEVDPGHVAWHQGSDNEDPWHASSEEESSSSEEESDLERESSSSGGELSGYLQALRAVGLGYGAYASTSEEEHSNSDDESGGSEEEPAHVAPAARVQAGASPRKEESSSSEEASSSSEESSSSSEEEEERSSRG